MGRWDDIKLCEVSRHGEATFSTVPRAPARYTYAATAAEESLALVAKTTSSTSSTTLSGVEAPEVTPITKSPLGSQSFEQSRGRSPGVGVDGQEWRMGVEDGGWRVEGGGWRVEGVGCKSLGFGIGIRGRRRSRS